ncbi:MAG: hypothetical protein LBE76_07365 [Nitrososphaerota archaeon]|jgi:hypothetical protein|nr:hypothetical protein [Nitrososphaerota archaeon]
MMSKSKFNMRFLGIDANIIKLYDPVLGWGVNIQVSPKGIHCTKCDTDNCIHIEFALAQAEVANTVRKMQKQGWNLPDV